MKNLGQALSMPALPSNMGQKAQDLGRSHRLMSCLQYCVASKKELNVRAFKLFLRVVMLAE